MDLEQLASLAAIVAIGLGASAFVGCGFSGKATGPPETPPPPPPPPPGAPPPPVPPPTVPTTRFQLNLAANLQSPPAGVPQLKVRRISRLFWTLRNSAAPSVAQISVPTTTLTVDPGNGTSIPIDPTTAFLDPADDAPASVDALDSTIGTRNEVICTVELVLRLAPPTAPETTLLFNAGVWSPLVKGSNHIYVLSTDLASPTRTFKLTFQAGDG